MLFIEFRVWIVFADREFEMVVITFIGLVVSRVSADIPAEIDDVGSALCRSVLGSRGSEERFHEAVLLSCVLDCQYYQYYQIP